MDVDNRSDQMIESKVKKETVLKWTPREGEDFPNRARYNLRRLLWEKDRPIYKGLKCITFKSLYNFVGGVYDMRLSTLEKIANEIGVDFLEFFTPIPEEDS
jgi:hypothetical protein